MELPILDMVQHLSGKKTATHYLDSSGNGRDAKFVYSPAIYLPVSGIIQCPQDLTGVTIVEYFATGTTLIINESLNQIVSEDNGVISRVILSDGTDLVVGYCDNFIADRVNGNHATHNGSESLQDDFHFLETLGYAVYDNGDSVVLGVNNNAINYPNRIAEKIQLPIVNRWIGGCGLDFTNGNSSQTWVTDILANTGYVVPTSAKFGFLHRTDKRNPHFCRWNDSFSDDNFILYNTEKTGQDLIDIEEWLDNGPVSLFVSADGDNSSIGSFISPLLTVKSAHDNINDGDIVNIMYNQIPRKLSGNLTFDFQSSTILTSSDLTAEIFVGDSIKNENSLWYKVTDVTSTEISIEVSFNNPKYMDDSFIGSGFCITPTMDLWSFFAEFYTKNYVTYNGSVDRSGKKSKNGVSFCYGKGQIRAVGCNVNNTIFNDTCIGFHSSSDNSVIENIIVTGTGLGSDSTFYSAGDNTIIKNIVITNGLVGIYGNNVDLDYIHIFNYNSSAFNSSLVVGANNSTLKRVRLRYASFVGVDAMGVSGVNNKITYYPIIDENNNIFDDTGSENSFVKIEPVINNAPTVPVYLDNIPSLFVDGNYVIGYKSSVNNSAFSSEKTLGTPVNYTPSQGRNEIQILAKFDDGYWQPETDPTTVIIYAYTELVRAYLGVLINLLPQGDMWKVRDTRVLAGLLTAFAVEYEKFDVSVNKNLFNLFAHKTVDYLTEWETDMGIPGECRILEPTIERRRQTILSKFRRFGGNTASKEYLENLIKEFGYDITIVEYPDTVDFATKGVFDFEVWSDYASTDTTLFRAGSSRAGDRLINLGTNIMDCVLNKFKPFGTTVTFKVNT